MLYQLSILSDGMADGEDARKEAEDARRETALASTLLFQPNFKPSKVTQAQLDKLKDLHRKRLKLKEKAKGNPKSKEIAQRSVSTCAEDIDFKYTTSPAACNSDGSSKIPVFDLKDQNAPCLIPNKRRKLRWGLDAKERWERKANM
ncbi:uncharacterized protein LOC122042426 [Zingiber officinale]|uniref:uncharacterized protein LOC122042426 n=1 Tax=Zingiber officinale TaxID=94328 RepID=UPI001C4A8C73|nr:uncharacterized protein LOC122042426 [Zingiber officinale]